MNEKYDFSNSKKNPYAKDLKKKVSSFADSINRIPSLTDYMIIASLAFGAVGFAHFGADGISTFLKSNFEVVRDKSSALSSFGSQFFWMISIATAIGILLSFTKKPVIKILFFIAKLLVLFCISGRLA